MIATKNRYFPSPLQEFQYFDKYARFNYEKGRRETWDETVDRAVDFLKELSDNKLDENVYSRIRNGILDMKIMPSMRLLAMAGPAARRSHITLYNCSYITMDSIDSLVEELIISMSGTGVGFSVEKKYTDKFPTVKPQTHSLSLHTVEDSTEGWADAFRMGLECWFGGTDIVFDYSRIREAGTPLKIKGGTASGPQPLKNLLDFARDKILSNQGGKLKPIDIHDIACKVGESIVSGGVRRTALLSLFDRDDKEMLNCKNGDAIVGNEQRWLANNSGVWETEFDLDGLSEQMNLMVDGQRGEPGIFSRFNANLSAPYRRRILGPQEYGTNPCGEINLRPLEFCNLSIAIARPEDNLSSLKEKIELAAIIGTIQSMATNFPGLRPEWKKNCEEERLLGVDITGGLDTEILSHKNPNLASTLETLKDHAVKVNEEYARKLDINPSSSVTCVKPSGNSSQLLDTASGLHARHYKHYIRNVRVGAKTPIFELLRDQGVPMDPENGQTWETMNTAVAHFPVKSPDHAVTKHEMSAIDQCNYWLAYKKSWTEHNPSVTISYHENEVKDLIRWLYIHKFYIGGMSFLPVNDIKYDQLPYQEITEEEYKTLSRAFPQVDFGKLSEYETTDQTTASQELACVSGACDVDDIPVESAPVFEFQEISFV